MFDEILNRSYSLLTVPEYVVKSTVSYFEMFKQLKWMLKSALKEYVF